MNCRLRYGEISSRRIAGIPVAGKFRPACGHAAETCSRDFWRNPKGVEMAVLQVKAKSDRLVRDGRQIFNTIPANSV
jgi:hypothetical protein